MHLLHLLITYVSVFITTIYRHCSKVYVEGKSVGCVEETNDAVHTASTA